MTASPEVRVKAIIDAAAWNASMASASLSLPPGPWGIVTIIPELLTIWKIQRQMVADIAAVYGKTASLNQEAMMYCLLKQGATVTMATLVTRCGTKYLVKKASSKAIQQILSKVGISLSQKLISRGIARFVPFAGAVCMGGFSYRDTQKVGKTAQDLFSADIQFDNTTVNEPIEVTDTSSH